jgi:pimeloyl-ACP methyl ester carboxylesterase
MDTSNVKSSVKDPRGTNKLGRFVNAAYQAAYTQAYDELMAAMPEATDALDVPTAWGSVRVYAWGHPSAGNRHPVVLLPGRSSGVPMWRDNLAGCMTNHTVYALDALGDAGKSYQTVPFHSYEDTVGWISETLKFLKIGKAHLVGHSFGAGFAANFALLYPEQVATAALLEPAFALNYPSAGVLFWATVGSLGFLPKPWRDYGLAKMTGGDPQVVSSGDAMARMITAASAGFSAKLPAPKTLSANELKQLAMPVYVALGGKSPITGKGAAKNVRCIPKVTARLFENGTHSLPMEYPEKIGEALNGFWGENA